jgi:hypothetical protein
LLSTRHTEWKILANFNPEIPEKNDKRNGHMKTKRKISGYFSRSAGGIIILLAFAILSVLFTGPRSAVSKPAAPSRRIASIDLGDVAVDIGNSTIKKLSAVDGTVLWSVSVTNDGALAVDPSDLGVYTGYGNHNYVGSGTVYKYAANGTLKWTSSISVGGVCNFYYVSYAAVDAASARPGVVWTQTGCFGGMAKTSRSTGAQKWSTETNDIGRASIDPSNGQIYDITNAGPTYNYNTIYSVSADGNTLNSARSCEGYTDLNPADGMLYRGGNRCGVILAQMDKVNLGATNWTLDLSSYISSFDALAVQPWCGGYIYVASAADSKIVVVDPSTQTVVRIFTTAIGANNIAVNPAGGNLYITDGSSHFVYAYTPTGSLIWTSPDLGGAAGSIAAPKGIVGTPTLLPHPPQPQP